MGDKADDKQPSKSSTNVTPNVMARNALEQGFQQGSDICDVSDKKNRLRSTSVPFQVGDRVRTSNGEGMVIEVKDQEDYYRVEGKDFRSWFPRVQIG